MCGVRWALFEARPHNGGGFTIRCGVWLPFVGVERFELSTSRTRTVYGKCATGDYITLVLRELCGLWLGPP